jgi:hypothetical protein
MLAEVIAGVASGLSMHGSLAGEEICCLLPAFKGRQIMVAFEMFLEEHPTWPKTLWRRQGGLLQPRVSLPDPSRLSHSNWGCSLFNLTRRVPFPGLDKHPQFIDAGD